VYVEPYETGGAIQEPLDSRAWALQEALISPRVLQYGTNQISWKCCMLEENANGPLNTLGGPRAKTEAWTSTVVGYTARQLTFNSDRLAALSGYAKLLGSKRPYDQYLAGMWKSELLEQLLWYRSSKSDPNPRLSPSCAPTWSWASIDSAVNFTYWPDYYQSHSEIVSIPSASSSIFNGTQQSTLGIQSYVKRLQYSDFFRESEGRPLFFPKHNFQSNRKNGPQHPSGEVIIDISGPFEAFKNNPAPELVCLHMTPTCGLILVVTRKDATSNKDIYERIGLATGSVFEEWFTDTTCGLYSDEVVRII